MNGESASYATKYFQLNQVYETAVSERDNARRELAAESSRNVDLEARLAVETSRLADAKQLADDYRERGDALEEFADRETERAEIRKRLAEECSRLRDTNAELLAKLQVLTGEGSAYQRGREDERAWIKASQDLVEHEAHAVVIAERDSARHMLSLANTLVVKHLADERTLIAERNGAMRDRAAAIERADSYEREARQNDADLASVIAERDELMSKLIAALAEWDRLEAVKTQRDDVIALMQSVYQALTAMTAKMAETGEKFS